MNGIEVIFNNIWVLFLLFTLVWPRLRQQALDRARKRELSNLGGKRGSNVITLIHRQETLSLFGLPIARYIDIDDSEEVLRAIRLTPDQLASYGVPSKARDVLLEALRVLDRAPAEKAPSPRSGPR